MHAFVSVKRLLLKVRGEWAAADEKKIRSFFSFTFIFSPTHFCGKTRTEQHAFQNKVVINGKENASCFILGCKIKMLSAVVPGSR